MNIRRLLVEGNHLMQLGAKAVLAELRAPPAHGKVAQRAMTGIEMAVVHQIAGRIDRAGFDFEARPFLAFTPDHGKSFALSDTNDCAGTVAMKGTAAACGKFLDV